MSATRMSRALAAVAAIGAVACGGATASAAPRSAAPPPAVMILLDINASMQPQPAATERQVASAYLDALPSNVRAGLITFNASWSLVQRPTTNHHALAATIVSSPRSGVVSSGLDGALAAGQEALSALGPGTNVRMLVLSDAEVLTGSAPTSTVPVDVVTWRLDGDDHVTALLSLATATGGRVATASGAAGLASVFPAVSRPSAPTSALPAGAPWQFSASLLAAVAVLAVAIAAIVLVAAGSLSSGRRGRQVAGHVSRYGPGRRAASKPADADAPNKVVGAALGLAERALQVRGADRSLATRLDLAGLTIKPAEFVVLGACGGLVLAAGLTVLLHTWLLGIPVGLLAAGLGMWLLLSVRTGRRRAAFSEQLPDVLQLVASSLQSGFSLAQALDAVVREGTQPAAGEFSRALSEARIGAELTDGLDGVATRMDSQDMHWTVMAIRIQRSVGGNLAEVLRNTISTMRERAFLRRHVKALSAEGRLSAYILIALPVLIGGWLMYSSPSYMRVLYTTLPGVIMLGGSILLLGVGALWMRILIRVEV